MDVMKVYFFECSLELIIMHTPERFMHIVHAKIDKQKHKEYDNIISKTMLGC